MATMNGSVRPASQETAISDSVVGALPAGGRGAPRPDPEVLARPKRRTFTGEYKQQVLAEAETARGSGEIGVVLRRHGLYSSHLTKWRKERKTGILEGLAPQKRGPKSKAEEEARAIREGLDKESVAIYDLLKKPELNPKEIARIKQVAVQLLTVLKAEQLRVNQWRDKAATRDAVRATIFDFLYSDNTGLPEAYTDDEIKTKSENVFQHVFYAYPTIPSPIYEGTQR